MTRISSSSGITPAGLHRRVFARIEESKGALQLIVSDHADIDKPWFQQAVVARWRNGVGMVPSAWSAPD